MTTLLKTAAIAALITGFANTAQAGTPYAFQSDDYLAMVEPVKTITPDSASVETLQFAALEQDGFSETSRIAVARIDGGRLIPTPYGEEFDWQLLDKRFGTCDDAVLVVVERRWSNWLATGCDNDLFRCYLLCGTVIFSDQDRICVLE